MKMIKPITKGNVKTAPPSPLCAYVCSPVTT